MDQHAIEVWTRAAMPGIDLEQVSAGAMPTGTLKLAYLLRFHNAVMNGGLAFAVEISSDDLLRAAIEASSYYSLADLAQFLEQVAAIRDDDDALEDLDEEYMRLTGEDSPGPGIIDHAFEAKLAATPEDFDDNSDA